VYYCKYCEVDCTLEVVGNFKKLRQSLLPEVRICINYEVFIGDC